MRIITGTLKGRRIDIPKNLDVRPTTDRTKEGLFSTIESWKYIWESTVLDLFAGSGNLGFEALSRGASKVLFVDAERRNINYIENLAEEFGVSDRVRTAVTDVPRFLDGPAVPYDLIFADPPYTYPDLEQVVEAVLANGWLNREGWLMAEHNRHYDFREHQHLWDEKQYGRTMISIFSLQSEEE